MICDTASTASCNKNELGNVFPILSKQIFGCSILFTANLFLELITFLPKMVLWNFWLSETEKRKAIFICYGHRMNKSLHFHYCVSNPHFNFIFDVHANNYDLGAFYTAPLNTMRIKVQFYIELYRQSELYRRIFRRSDASESFGVELDWLGVGQRRIFVANTGKFNVKVSELRTFTMIKQR